MSGIGEWAIRRDFGTNGFIEITIELSKATIQFWKYSKNINAQVF